jgi:hypothetical protein
LLTEAKVVMARRLSEAPWFKDIYKRIYETLAVDGFLPPPEDIVLVTAEEARIKEKDVKGSSGCVIIHERDADGGFRREFFLWFRKEPPDPELFAHELIHICRCYKSKRSINRLDENEEELVACALGNVIVTLAAHGIVPMRNPLATLMKSYRASRPLLRAPDLGPLADSVAHFLSRFFDLFKRLDGRHTG